MNSTTQKEKVRGTLKGWRGTSFPSLAEFQSLPATEKAKAAEAKAKRIKDHAELVKQAALDKIRRAETALAEAMSVGLPTVAEAKAKAAADLAAKQAAEKAELAELEAATKPAA